VCLGVSLLAGCLAPQPILYPNEALESRDEDQVDRDIDDCARLAKEYNAKPNRAGEIAGQTAEDAAIGGAAGAAGGAVLGNPGAGAAAGAAAGATGGLVRAIFRTHRDPSPAYRAFVERCLAERGYDVIGWE